MFVLGQRNEKVKSKDWKYLRLFMQIKYNSRIKISRESEHMYVVILMNQSAYSLNKSNGILRLNRV